MLLHCLMIYHSHLHPSHRGKLHISKPCTKPCASGLIGRQSPTQESLIKRNVKFIMISPVVISIYGRRHSAHETELLIFRYVSCQLCQIDTPLISNYTRTEKLERNEIISVGLRLKIQVSENNLRSRIWDQRSKARGMKRSLAQVISGDTSDAGSLF